MTAPVVDERPHATTIKTVLGSALGLEPVTNDVRVYDFGEVPGADGNPGKLPRIFATISIERVALALPKADRRPTRSAWRLSCRFAGRNVDEARWAAAQITGALDGQRLTIDGRESTPVRHEPGDPIQKDGDRFTGLSSWVYGL